VSFLTAAPLEVTRASRPSGERATPQGPVSPGPSFGTVITRPAGVMRQPLGRADCGLRCDAKLHPLERAVCATAAASSTITTVQRLNPVRTTPPSGRTDFER